MDWLGKFVAESNRIEGYIRKPWTAEIDAHAAFLVLKTITVPDMERLVGILAPGHVIRDRDGLNVRVGSYIAPRGGKEIRWRLDNILLHMDKHSAFAVHCNYELLHPFTDGNGRSGRALWLWHLQNYDREEFARAKAIGFLHTFYYQTLAAQQSPTGASR